MKEYDELVQAITSAVPEIKERDCNCVTCYHNHAGTTPITLEDVFRAVGGKGSLFQKALRNWGTHQRSVEILSRWHLGSPLSDQTEETINFLHSLLCPQK